MANRWWVIQDPGGSPQGVIGVIEGDGLPRSYVPGVGLVDWPAMTMFTHMGETGAYRITEDEAIKLMRRGVGRTSPDVLARQRGSAPTIQPPGM